MSQKSVIGPEALILNPALKDLGFLIGNWSTTGTHPQASTKTLRGRTSFSWHEGGAFMIMHSEIDEPEFPSGVAMIGSDDTKGKLAMLYFDERGTSRVFEVTVETGRIAWRRDDPDISQSNVITAEQGGNKLVGRGRISQGGKPWADDLSQVYVRDKRR